MTHQECVNRARHRALFNSFALLTVVLCLTHAPAALAHGGRLNAEGCHNEKKHGGYHCHRSGSVPSNASSKPRTIGPIYYKNCAAARNAGAAPVMQGEPGYGRHLDRDGDGIGCE
ncbi:excalibur calcium-binding domain-containing protein [Lysobacter sp. GCM10012299]|uniref:excalibur calcium-binding domain-containing protein n=1 Tax=Lysobacter sp. GCM10012299 TaxID=3317333 RepID=UPI00361E1409